MKKILLLLFLGLLAISCEVKEAEDEMSKLGQYLEGNHQLLPLSMRLVEYVENDTTRETMIDDYGEFNEVETIRPIVKTKEKPIYYKIRYFGEKNYLRFKWVDNLGDDVLMDIPFNKVRIEHDKNVKIPEVKFRWSPCCNHNMTEGLDYIINENLIYVVIVGNSESLPQF